MFGAESVWYKLPCKYKFHSYWSIKILMVNKDIKDFFLLPHKSKLKVSSFLYLFLGITKQGSLLLQKQEASTRNVKTTSFCKLYSKFQSISFASNRSPSMAVLNKNLLHFCPLPTYITHLACNSLSTKSIKNETTQSIQHI